MRFRPLTLHTLFAIFLGCVSPAVNLKAQTPPTPPQISAPGNSVVDDLNFWNAIKDSKNPDDFNVYLKKFPRGEFADLARIRVATLSKGSSTNSLTPSGGMRGGVGIQFELRDNRALIKQIDPNGPAARAAIKPQDEIVKVDGQETLHLTQEQIAAAVRGTAGTEVTLTIKSGESSAVRDVVLTRAYSTGLAAAQNADAALQFEKKELWTEAEAQYREALKLASEVAWYHGELGYALHRQNKVAEAESEYRQALRLDGKLARYHNLLAFLLYTKIDQNADAQTYNEALTEAKEAVQLDANDAWNHNMIGLILLAQKKWKEAESEFAAAVRLDPRNDKFKENMVKAQKHQRH